MEEAGYTPVALDEPGVDDAEDEDSETGELKRLLIMAAEFTLSLFAIAMARVVLPGAAMAMNAVAPPPAWTIVELGWGELKHAAPGMNSLVMIGSNAAYFYSLLALVALILLGRYLEALARGRTSSVRANGRKSMWARSHRVIASPCGPVNVYGSMARCVAACTVSARHGARAAGARRYRRARQDRHAD